jgi:hypothetical protein
MVLSWSAYSLPDRRGVCPAPQAESLLVNEMKDQPICQIDKLGTKRWRLHGKLHREDGPAVEYVSGSKFWYLHDQYHREDGPAVEYTNGTKYWYLYDKLHRADGPAIELASGSKWWWYHGKKLNCQTNEEFLRLLKLKAFW